MPDWDLLCPTCRYPLKGLPAHRCPECGAALDIPAIVRPWSRLRPPQFTGEEEAFPDFGLHCGACAEPLAGAEHRECPHCQSPFNPREFVPRHEWFAVTAAMCGGLPTQIVELILEQQYIPFVTHDHKTMFDIYMGSRSVGAQMLVHREFYFDMLWHIRAKQTELAQRQAAGSGKTWTCPACREEVPDHFDLCWSCQHERMPD